MIQNIALVLFLDKPLVLYGGICTLLLLVFTAAVGSGKIKLSVKWHRILAATTIIFALGHAIFGLSIYFNF